MATVLLRVEPQTLGAVELTCHSRDECHAISRCHALWMEGCNLCHRGETDLGKQRQHQAQALRQDYVNQGIRMPRPNHLFISNYKFKADRTVESHLRRTATNNEVVATDDWIEVATTLITTNSITTVNSFETFWNQSNYYVQSLKEMKCVLFQNQLPRAHQAHPQAREAARVMVENADDDAVPGNNNNNLNNFGNDRAILPAREVTNAMFVRGDNNAGQTINNSNADLSDVQQNAAMYFGGDNNAGQTINNNNAGATINNFGAGAVVNMVNNNNNSSSSNNQDGIAELTNEIRGLRDLILQGQQQDNQNHQETKERIDTLQHDIHRLLRVFAKPPQVPQFMATNTSS